MNKRVRRKKVKQFKEVLSGTDQENPYVLFIWGGLRMYASQGERAEYRYVRRWLDIVRNLARSISRAYAEALRQEKE